MAMPHAMPSISDRRARRLAVRRRAPFVRWEESFDRLNAGDWWYIIKDDCEELGKLTPKVRTKIRKGDRLFDAGPMDRKTIVAEGYDVYRVSFDRYSTFETILGEREFRRAIEGLPEQTEFWGLREKKSRRLVAFSENMVRDGACLYVTTWFRPESLKASGGYAGYFLFHEMNRHYLNNRSVRYISDGARSISHQTRVHEFLETNFGFRKAYCRLRVAYYPGFGLVVYLLYPFRKWFAGRSGSLWRKLTVLLEQERIRRSCVLARDDA